MLTNIPELLAKDQTFLDRMIRLAKEAERVLGLADKMANQSATVLPFLTELFGGRHEIVCGKPAQEERQSDEAETGLFWNSVRSLVAVQFGVSSPESARAIAALALTQNRELDPDSSLFDMMRDKRQWLWPTAGPPKFAYARAFALLALYQAVASRSGKVERRTPAQVKHQEDRLKSRSAFLQSLSTILSAVKSNAPPYEELCWRVRILKMLRMVDLGAYAATTEELRTNKLDDLDKLEKRLRNRLALSLQEANAETTEFEVAEMVAVLGGRYLNPLLRIEPAHCALYAHAVEYVLKGRQPGKGSWRSEFSRDGLPPTQEEQDAQRLTNPLAGPYWPLACVLDLPNTVLMGCLPLLADSVTDVLGTLKRDLESEKDDKYRRINDAIDGGLLIGTAAADRLRDLVSEMELDALGAEIPPHPIEWQALSDSLGFRENLRRGAINLWKVNSTERPGAILVFGPPGTGKTIIAASLLTTLNESLRKVGRGRPGEEWRFLSLSPADFARQGSDRIIASAETLFRRLQRVRRCVVLLDEMEEFLRVRGPGSTRDSRLITTAFLPLLQETVDRREIILIVATNFVGTIDPAITRRGRFDLILPLGPPNMKSRLAIIDKWLDENHAAKLKQYQKDPGSAAVIEKHKTLVAKYTMGYTWAEIRDFQNELWSTEVRSKSDLTFELWRIRQERVPMALSGNPGCNWRTFRDEASRFMRGVAGIRGVADGGEEPDDLAVAGTSGVAVEGEDPDDRGYWIEPKLPTLENIEPLGASA